MFKPKIKTLFLKLEDQKFQTGHLKTDKTKILMADGSLMKVESIAEICNTFDLHSAIIGLTNQFLMFLRVAVIDRFYCK